MRPSIARFTAALGIAAITTSLVPLVQFVSAQSIPPTFSECSDGVDNDFDGLIDYPQDESCTSLDDDAEGANRGIFLTLSDNKQTVYPSGSLTYTIALSTDRVQPQLADVRFLMPHQTNLISASDAGYREGVYITWKNVSIFPGRTRELYVNVQVNPSAKTNLLLTPEVVADGQRASDTTRVVEQDDVPQRVSPQLDVTDGKIFAQPTEILTYKIRARNITFEDRTFTLRVQLPPQLSFLDASPGYSRDKRLVQWTNQTLQPREGREFLLTVYVERSTQDFTAVRLRVSAGAELATDTTTIVTQPVATSPLLVHITDGMRAVRPGEQVTYAISIRNDDSILETGVAINLALSPFVEFVSASEGGFWIGNGVRWEGRTLSPFGSKTFYVTGRVRSDAPIGTALRATVRSLGTEAVDVTEVSIVSTPSANRAPVQSNRLIESTADRSEVRPGDQVTFTVTVRNTTNRPLSNLRVENRLDPNMIPLSQAVENIPILQPGEVWQGRITVRIAPTTRHGMSLRSIATISGRGLENVPLTERTANEGVRVVQYLPETGAANDVLFMGLLGLLGALMTTLQRRKVRAIA